ncbi:unnamed protein product, partial [marine sediment metagenome]
GQNRLRAAQEIGLEVQYKVLEMESNNERLPYVISRINTTSRTWTSRDFLELYISLEKSDYIRFSEFIEKYKLPISDALNIVSKADTVKGGKHSVDFRNGVLSFEDGRMNKCIVLAEQVNEIRYFDVSYEEFQESPKFVKAISILVLHKNYEHKKMISKLSTRVTRIMKSSQTRDYIGVLFNLYNDGVQKHMLVA